MDDAPLEALVSSDIFQAHVLPALGPSAVAALKCVCRSISSHVCRWVRPSDSLFALLEDMRDWCVQAHNEVIIHVDFLDRNAPHGVHAMVILHVGAHGILLHIQHTIQEHDVALFGIRRSDVRRYRNRQYASVASAGRHLPIVCKLRKAAHAAPATIRTTGMVIMELSRGYEFVNWKLWMEGMARLDQLRRFFLVSQSDWSICAHSLMHHR
jgi:hypothetical protein